ncbi:MAG TPA: hypothetical protein VHE81_18835 [Lacipirellulaceae bacterium]|nr:hypothetical protein [Lacipirellulaceae bacterium]
MPGIECRPLKKLTPNPEALKHLPMRWRAEAEAVGRRIDRTIVAYEAGRDGFWLARWMRMRRFETHIIHPTSVVVPREHRRSKTDPLDAIMLMRVFPDWLHGERGHCSMVVIPSLEEERRQTAQSRAGVPRRRADPHHQQYEGRLTEAGNP